MTAMLSGNWEVVWKLLSHPLHFEIFPLSFIKNNGLEDSGIVGFGGKGKPWGTDGWSGQITTKRKLLRSSYLRWQPLGTHRCRKWLL